MEYLFEEREGGGEVLKANLKRGGGIELNATIKYYQRIANEKGLGAIPYLAISKCRRVVWVTAVAEGGVGGGGGRNRGCRARRLAASTELEITLEIALGGRWFDGGGSSRMGRERGKASGASPFFYYSKIGIFMLEVLISQQRRALGKKLVMLEHRPGNL